MSVRRVPGPGKGKLEKLAQDLKGMEARAGWFGSSKYEDGTPAAYVAAVQEFGDPGSGIPPRPFMRPTVAAKRVEWTAKARQLLKTSNSAHNVLQGIGSVVAADFQEAIAAVYQPPLKTRTLYARKKRGNRSTKPLVDTRYMFNTLTSTVEKSQ